MTALGHLRPPQPTHRCIPPLPLYPRIADWVDAHVKGGRPCARERNRCRGSLRQRCHQRWGKRHARL